MAIEDLSLQGCYRRMGMAIEDLSLQGCYRRMGWL